MFDITQLVGIPQLGVLSVLQTLSTVFRDAAVTQDQKVPVVSVYLKSGQFLQGYVVGHSSSGAEKRSIVIANYRQDPKASQDLSYVFVDEIAGLTIHEAESIVDHISDGLINRPLSQTPSAEDISKFLERTIEEFNRHLRAMMSAELSQVSDSSTDEERENLMYTVFDWAKVMRKLMIDEVRSQALADKSMNFYFKISDNAKIEIKDGTQCHISIGKSSEKVTRVLRETMLNALEDEL